MFIPRIIESNLVDRIQQGKKIVLLYGPRQAGKTTLVKKILGELNFSFFSVNADQLKYVEVLASRDLAQIRDLIQGNDLLFIDEAQRIPDIGLNLKLLHDEWPELRIIATGSSSFDLANQVSEPLTGRAQTYSLYPIGFCELAHIYSRFELVQQRENFLRFGMYPERFSLSGAEEISEYLRELTNSYLFKDVLELTSVRKTTRFQKLLQLLAFQVGSMVSLQELAQVLGMSRDTVDRYLDLLEQSFVIFRLSGFSRNLRKEITKTDKVFFWDTGIRNALIDDFRPLTMRNDGGALWENFLVAERRKSLAFLRKSGRSYFWRTYQQAELDYIEEGSGHLKAFEFKTRPRSVKAPTAWTKAYPEATFDTIHPENFVPFLLLEDL